MNVAWQRAAQAAVDAAIDEEAYAAVGARADELADQHNEALDTLAEVQSGFSGLRDELTEMNASIERPEPPELPEAEIDETAHNPLLDLDWGLASGAQALKARKAYEDDE